MKPSTVTSLAAVLTLLAAGALAVPARAGNTGDTKVVRDHRGQSNNNTAPPQNGAWGNDSGATVRDHRKPPAKLPCLTPGLTIPTPGCT